MAAPATFTTRSSGRHQPHVSYNDAILTNFPPAVGASAHQWYDVSKPEKTLCRNLNALNLHVLTSEIPKAGLGLFTEEPIGKGAIVGYMWGKFVEDDDWSSITSHYCDPTHQDGEEDFVEPVKRGILRCITVDQQANGAVNLLASQQCPMGYINHASNESGQRANVSIDSTGLGQLTNVTSDRWKYFPIVATCDINRGSEILADYNWSDVVWNTVKGLMNHESRSQQPRGKELRQGSDVRSLMVDAPLYRESLVAQRRNMVRFIADNGGEFARLKYAPWTVLPSSCSNRELGSVVRSSDLIPSILGVFLTQPHKPAKDKTLALYYPGVLMSAPLLEKFNRLYHCPTAVRVPTLDYIDANGEKIEIDLLGDPTQPGPIINDGAKSNLAVNCSMEAIAKKVNNRLFSACRVGDNQIQVSAELVAIYLLPKVSLSTMDELLMPYGEAGFWKQLKLGEHCIICFSKQSDHANRFYQCEGDGGKCPVRRHLGCFPLSILGLSKNQLARIHFFCPAHLDNALRTSARVHTNEATPRRSGTNQAISDQLVFTPPPTRHHDPNAAASAPGPSFQLSPDQLVFTPPPTRHLDPIAAASAPGPSFKLSPDQLVFTPPPTRQHASAVTHGVTVINPGPNRVGHSLLQQFNAAAASQQPRNAMDIIQVSASNTQPRQSFYTDPGPASSSQSNGFDVESHWDFFEPALADDPDTDTESYENSSDISSDGSQSCKKSRSRVHPLNSIPSVSLSSALACPKTSVRKREHVVKLENFVLNYAPLTPAQQQALAAKLTNKIDKHSPPWYAPKANATTTILQSTVESDSKAASVNRWRESNAIAFDWGEYKSCCASNRNTLTLLASLSAPIAAKHSSLSVVNMFEYRIKCRADANNKTGFTSWVQEKLSQSIKSHVALEGGTVCVSCFRAIIGIGSTSLFQYKQSLSSDTLKTRTSQGLERTGRDQPKNDLARDGLMKLVQSLGNVQPNPRNKNLKIKEIVLPYVGEATLRQALNDLLEEQDPKSVLITKSTLNRALLSLRSRFGISISVSKSKQMCRCDHCDKLDNNRSRTKDRAKKLKYKAEKDSHLRTVKAQRDHFDAQKVQALMKPTDLWCITFDGMDQAKTKLPSRKRLAKTIEKLPRLGVHVVGAFCFGGPKRVLGLLNYPDVKKDAALSCTTFERILDIQWEALVEMAAPHGGSIGPATGWPSRIHVTFDNAPAEAKNQFFFRFMGLFVLHGVFEAISISNLIVGHTHDIVDQMFSVWAKLLRLNDCATYSKMRALFHEKYHSRVAGLVDLIRGTLPDAEAAFDPDAIELVEEARMADANGDAFAWSASAASDLEKFMTDIKLDTGIAPEIVLQTFSVDVRQWFEQSHARSTAHARENGEHYQISANSMKGVLHPYVFAIEKDTAGDVWLYNKFLINSHLSNHNGVVHHYPHQLTGSYTTRTPLWKSSDAARDRTGCDPIRLLPVKVDTPILHDTIEAFKALHCIDDEEETELEATLDGFKKILEDDGNACDACKGLIAKLAEIGVVSNKKDATAEEQAASKLKTALRNKANMQKHKHMKDPNFAVQHDRLRCKGWFTKWIERVKNHIRPAFDARGVSLPDAYVEAPYHIHPAELCSGPGELPVTPALARVDLSWLAEHGEPVIGQLVVVRAQARNEPFWIGKIIGVLSDSFEEDSEEGALGTANRMESIIIQAGPGDDILNSDVCEEDNGVEPAADEDHIMLADLLHLPAAAAAHEPATRKRTRATTSTPAAAASAHLIPTKRTKFTHSRHKPDLDLSDNDESDESDDESGDDDDDDANFEPDVGDDEARQAKFDSDSDEADVSDEGGAHDAYIEPQAAAAKSRPAATAAASSSAPRVEFGHLHRSDRLRSTKSLDDLPSYRVQWYDLGSADVARLRLNNDEYWNKLYQDHVIESDSVMVDTHPAALASPHMASLVAVAQFAPVPVWIVDMYKSCRFHPKPAHASENQGVIVPTNLILWGSVSNILTASHQLMGRIFTRIRLDLTEEESSASTHAAAADAAASSGRRRLATATNKSRTPVTTTARKKATTKTKAANKSNTAAASAASQKSQKRTTNSKR